MSAPKPKSLTISAEKGTSLRLIAHLPPNLPKTAGRDAIVCKLEAAVGKDLKPLEKLDRGAAYDLNERQAAAFALLETWCQNKLRSLLQLSKEKLAMLLHVLAGEPSFYWANRPNSPIQWEGMSLRGVSEFLDTNEADEAGQNATPKEARERAGASGAKQPGKGLEKTQESVVEPRRDFVIDGSPNFLAVKLPSRESAGYRALADLLKSEGFAPEPSNGKWWLRDKHKTLNFLARHRRSLESDWGARFTKNFRERTKHIRIAEVEAKTKETVDGFKLEVAVDAPGIEEQQLRQSLAVGREYVEGANGKIVLIEPGRIQQIEKLQQRLSGESNRVFSPRFEQKLHAGELADAELQLEELLPGWKPPETWQSRSGALRRMDQLALPPIPGELDAKLRNYQRIGVAWLAHLQNHKLAGILADEMGLGKTVQTIALIAGLELETESPAALVVCPASLVENWRREFQRFAPEIAVFSHYGSQRPTHPGAWSGSSVILTSYATLTNDSNLFQSQPWQLVVGDEAQKVKNPKAQASRAMRALKSSGRILLTGTPVENSLDDLRALFGFLMPGYLAKMPPGLRGEERSWYDERHRQQAAPYILRRTKRDVAPELPDRIEQVMYCHFGDAQQAIYNELLEKSRQDIFEMEMGGASDGKIQMAVFNQFLRLRQACADPRILKPETKPSDSAKLELFQDILEETIAEGQRMLVFSQFVSNLRLLKDFCTEQGYSYCYLDGATRNRMEVVDRFNDDDSIPVFLISLKAGGTGLNLTGASVVVHYEPWWNPAVEAQATDRAHRIGQTNTVTSIKLIAADSIEEQVLALQQSKRQLLQDLFEASEAANAKVSLAEMKALLGVTAN